MLQSCQLCDVAHDFRYDPLKLHYLKIYPQSIFENLYQAQVTKWMISKKKTVLFLRYCMCHWHKPADNTFEANTLAPSCVYCTSEITSI